MENNFYLKLLDKIAWKQKLDNSTFICMNTIHMYEIKSHIFHLNWSENYLIFNSHYGSWKFSMKIILNKQKVNGNSEMYFGNSYMFLFP